MRNCIPPLSECAERADRPAQPGRSANRIRKQILSILQKGTIDILFQPAIRLDCARIEFFEALARFESLGEMPPDGWFALAAEVGLERELESLAARCALLGFAALPEGASIAINLSPAVILEPGFLAQLPAAPLDRLIIEITEKHPIACYDAIVGVLEPLRRRGLRVAIDDAGAGYSSFRHILQIRPDIIKLDMTICRGIHEDPMRRALVSALTTFARQVGSELVAEGVETADELDSLRRLGVPIIQGYIFARPTRPESIGLPAIRSEPPNRIRRAA